MSTFNGIVDEFPNIRIDFFRHHAGKAPPQACFLSHVHSDHLQGLESLKMPFVYCSAATKKILLRMEKYPHRINFAKGILEARKQTYKSLRLVLRALPLETPVEIELGPKSKIRVSLFDANHCPGAVMFLIEGHGKAILYTGDVRAEPWWVNSIVRNPILLPYSCGAKKLDCMYLDTTFASRNDVYEHFPTKAEGLQELLSKVKRYPQESIFYFRSWTLGYEDVWIALSNFLESRIHVDEYQLRIFRSLAENADVVDRGSALAGFHFGNQFQFGCLTDDTTAAIHSCEPGTECHSNIKKRPNVVWITPIISRLKDGTEVAEVGAGGGGGDLYQVPQLEIVDQTVLEALEKLCGNSEHQKDALSWLSKAFAAAKSRGDQNIPMEDLGLDQDEEISLKQFVNLVSKRDEAAAERAKRTQDRTIHFPFSRHSSFSELRHLVSSFKPNDICPCTVDLDTWSEEVSIGSLFGDICSKDTFKYDQNIRQLLGDRLESRGMKRKHSEIEEDSQQTRLSDSPVTEEVFKSAETSLTQPIQPRIHIQKPSDPRTQNQEQQEAEPDDSPTVHIPTPVREFHQKVADHFDNLDRTEGQSEYAELSNEVAVSVIPQAASTQPVSTIDNDENAGSESDSDGSISTSAFESQNHSQNTHVSRATSRRRHAVDEPRTATKIDVLPSSRVEARRSAYRAARAVLKEDRHDEWHDLRLRSMGWKGHTEEETLL